MIHFANLVMCCRDPALSTKRMTRGSRRVILKVLAISEVEEVPYTQPQSVWLAAHCIAPAVSTVCPAFYAGTQVSVCSIVAVATVGDAGRAVVGAQEWVMHVTDDRQDLPVQ